MCMYVWEVLEGIYLDGWEGGWMVRFGDGVMECQYGPRKGV